MGYKAAAQVLKQAEDLRSKIATTSDLLNDNQAWNDLKKLQTLYHQVLILDLEYALDKKVEQDLWNIGFKTCISTLQDLVRDKKNPKRSDCQALLTWCLEAASGFYITLLQEICHMFDLDLPFRRRGVIYGQTKDASCSDNVNLPQSSSCIYICQYCLVHLGDLARYRNQRKQAESFYNQAIQVSPTSGHPYNQLALLEASQGDKLSTVFYYVRGIAVKNPFPASATNLASTLSSLLDKESSLQKIQTKMSSSEFIQLFLCTHEHIHSTTDLEQASVGVKSLNNAMTALVATESFTLDKLIKVTVINLYALKHLTGLTSIKTEELTEDEKKCKELILELLAASLSAFLVPVHTLKMERKTLLEYYALPAVKLLIYWIKQEPQVLNQSVFSNRLQIWPSLCKFLNNIQIYLKDFNYNKYSKHPLSEDRNLQGFLPLLTELKDLNFKLHISDSETEQLVRAKRILEFGIWLTKVDVNGRKLITQTLPEGTTIIHFEPGCVQPDPTNDLLEEMKSVNIGYKGDTQSKNAPEKRNGILKPQGSLEKSREERELLSVTETNNNSSSTTSSSSTNTIGNKVELAKMKRVKQNVALQSIFKKMEENKQVKFTMDESDKEVEKDKLVKFETKSVPKSQSVAANIQFSSTLSKSQSFSQNHPAFSTSTTKNDYLNNLRNINSHLEKGPVMPYPPNDISPKKNSNPPTLSYQTSQPIYQNILTNMPNKPQSAFSSTVPTSFAALPFNPSQPPPPLPNISSHSHQYNMWKPEDTVLQTPPWWQNSNTSLTSNHSPMSLNNSLQPNQLQLPLNNNSINLNHPPPNHTLPPPNHTLLPPTHSSVPSGHPMMQPSHSSLTSNKSPLTSNHPSIPSNQVLLPPNCPSMPSNHSSTTNMSLPLNHNYQTMDRFANNTYLFPNALRSNMQPYIQNNPVTKSQSSNDIFSSPWSSFSRANFIGDGNPVNYDNTRAISLRQAMLKEANNIPGDLCATMSRPVNQPSDKFLQNQSNASAYSLFNTSSWTPNLPGQLRSTSSNDSMVNSLPQQSLFTGQSAQSLTQLLEQQNKLQQNDS